MSAASIRSTILVSQFTYYVILTTISDVIHNTNIATTLFLNEATLLTNQEVAAQELVKSKTKPFSHCEEWPANFQF